MSQDTATETSSLTVKMKHELNLIDISADVKRVRDSSLSDEQVKKKVHITLS